MSGRLAGIARHAVRRGPIETIDAVMLSVDRGVEGDVRGVRKPDGRNRRQVSLMEASDWTAATAAIGIDLPWSTRRANLLVDGLDLPQIAGARIRIGADAVLEITVECDPCVRMDEIAMGLQEALRPDWRGGACARVIEEGRIAVGDEIRIET
ncbi:MAG: MOSC domain-containing protein [Pseudomonadota bacterium]